MRNNIQLIYKDRIKDPYAEQIAKKARDYLNINTGKIKIGKIFTILYKLTEKELKAFAEDGLSDKLLHKVYLNEFYQNPDYESYVMVSKLPGVTDDEGKSAQETLADFLNLDLEIEAQHIYTHKIYYFENKLSEQVLRKLAKNLLGNKLINHFEYGYSFTKISYVPQVKINNNAHTGKIDIFVSDADLERISKDMLLSLNLTEMRAIKEYFQSSENKAVRKQNGLTEYPTDCELEVLAQTWSEHCKHKEFAAKIKYINKETNETKIIDSLFKTYIKKSTDIIQKRLEKNDNNWLLKVFSDNAGVVKIDSEKVFVWKVETHNSPSAIDPYGGAITGILGNNRDPLGTGIGGARLLFNTNVLCFGPPDYNEKLLTGQLHPRRVFAGVRKGIEDGGNKSGIPTINGSIIFDERYAGKPLVYCGTGGIMPMKYGNRKSWEKNIEAGDLIIMTGGRVGKDGIHGATFSSAEISENSPQSAVQIGSPLTQKLLADFMIEAVKKDLIKCSTDNGAGGLSSSIGELAEISGGAVVYLEKVPLKYAHLNPWEIFISESQERMTFVIEKQKLTPLMKLAKERHVEISNIGNFTDTGYLDVNHREEKVAYLNMDFLHNGVPGKYMEAVWHRPELKKPKIKKDLNYEKIIIDLLGSINICSRENVIRQYDHEVKGKTIVKPLMGKDQSTPQDAAVMRLDFESYQGIAISNGIMPKFGDLDPYQMSAGAFDEAVRQIISVGGKLPDLKNGNNRFWSVNDNFCVPDSAYHPRKNPDGKFKLAKLVRMNEALFDMATFFNIPMTSGKDSMKNDFITGDKKISIPPTILYSMAAKIDDIRQTITSNVKKEGALLYQVGKTYNELGGSEFYQLFNETGINAPKVRKEAAKKHYLKMQQANEMGLIQSCHDLSDGGLAVALAECLFGSGFGAEIDILNLGNLENFVKLFAESHSRFIVSINKTDKKKFEQLFENDAIFLGKVTKTPDLKISSNGNLLVNIRVKEMENSWKNGLKFS